jgi:hypothetical protein
LPGRFGARRRDAQSDAKTPAEGCAAKVATRANDADFDDATRPSPDTPGGARLALDARDRAMLLLGFGAALLDPARYSGHSLRAGLATAAGDAGAALAELMRQTGVPLPLCIAARSGAIMFDSRQHRRWPAPRTRRAADNFTGFAVPGEHSFTRQCQVRRPCARLRPWRQPRQRNPFHRW